MNINLHQHTPLEGEITIALSEEDYMPSLAENIRIQRAKSIVKGFRKGQVPASIIQKLYGSEILFRTTLDLAIKNLNSYLTDHSLDLLQDPILVDNTLYAGEPVDKTHPGIIEIKFMYGLKPDIDLSSVQQIKLNQLEIKNIGDEAIMEVIQKLQIQYGTTQEVLQAEQADMIHASLTSTTENIQLVYLPAAGMKIGKEEISFLGLHPHDKLTLHFSPEARYSLPNSQPHYHETNKLLQHLTGSYELTIEKIYRPLPAELNQDFFLKIFPNQAITNLEELKDQVKYALLRHAQLEADNSLMSQLKQAVLDQLAFELPVGFIKKGLQAKFPNWNEELIETYYRLYTQSGLRWSLISEKVMQEYDIQVSTTEIAQYLQLKAPNLDVDLKQLSEKIEQNLRTNHPDKSYQEAYHWAIENKVLNALKSKVKLQLQEKTVEEFNKLMADLSHPPSPDYQKDHQHHDHGPDHTCPDC